MNYSPIIQVPFGNSREVRTSARYHWDSRHRGEDPFVIIQVSLKGSGQFKKGAVTERVPEGWGFMTIVPEEASYGYPPDAREEWEFCWVNFYGDLAVMLFDRLREKFGSIFPLGPESRAARSLMHLIERGELKSFQNEFELSKASYSFYLDLWQQLSHPDLGMADPVELGQEYYRAHWQRPIPVKELANRYGVSREHFTRLFTKKTGSSPAKFLRELRLREARILIKKRELPLSEVAMRCGFSSRKHLSRCLGQMEG
ncbi:MAG: helix-turn-helix domain-containing protein [Verrucomicrobiota bacterium]|nr:helix-turn-helix domain-containing protein [Verrucomicrobiota bacterium]